MLGHGFSKFTFKDLSRGSTLIELDSQAHAIETSEVTLEFETAWNFPLKRAGRRRRPVRKRYHLKFKIHETLTAYSGSGSETLSPELIRNFRKDR